MKILKSINVLLLAILLSGCASDNDIFDVVDSIAAPSNISADIIISQDNTGSVTITPNGQGVSQFEVHFNDGTDENAILSKNTSCAGKCLFLEQEHDFKGLAALRGGLGGLWG